MRKTVKNKPCLICGSKKNKGVHFGVDCCRACSAFYRRSIEKKKVFKCQRGTKKCDLTIKIPGTPLCRYCRLKKCKKLGMQLEQENSEIPSVPENAKNSEVTLYNPKHVQKPYEPKFNIDHVIEVLKQDATQSVDFNMPLLKNLNFCYTEFLQKMLPQLPIVVANEIDPYAQRDFQEKYMFELAKILMQIKEFAGLKFNDRIRIFNHIRNIFLNIERQYSSNLIFGDSLEDFRLLNDDVIALNISVNEITMKSVDNDLFQKTIPFWIPVRDKLISMVMKPMKILKVTQFEVAYLLVQLLCNIEFVPDLSDEAIKFSEKVSDQITSEIHDYYVYEMKLENYAPRLLKLHQLIDGSKAVEAAKMDAMVMSQVFDLYNYNTPLSELGKTR